jgi:hypothetical protein
VLRIRDVYPGFKKQQKKGGKKCDLLPFLGPKSQARWDPANYDRRSVWFGKIKIK